MDQDQSIGDRFATFFTELATFLPKLLGFIVILIIGFIVAGIVKGLITKLLQRVGLDRTLKQGTGGQYIERASPQGSPSALLANLARYAILLLTLSIAVGVLGIPLLEQGVATIIGYIPTLLAALLIFIVAGALAGGIGGIVARTMGDTPTGKLIGAVAPALIMSIAVFMILEQLGIAPEIVRIAFGAIMGGLALGLALAFGLGGRETAGRLVNDAYRKGQEQRGQVKGDLQAGRDRGQAEAQERAPAQAQQAAQRAQQETGGGPGGGAPGRDRGVDPTRDRGIDPGRGGAPGSSPPRPR
jgi:small-conductance mechanosensitive channel